jgi:hypothetical protein
MLKLICITSRGNKYHYYWYLYFLAILLLFKKIKYSFVLVYLILLTSHMECTNIWRTSLLSLLFVSIGWYLPCNVQDSLQLQLSNYN